MGNKREYLLLTKSIVMNNKSLTSLNYLQYQNNIKDFTNCFSTTMKLEITVSRILGEKLYKQFIRFNLNVINY